jgi:hypothetical protein
MNGGKSVQLMPLQNLNIGLLEVKTTCEHACDVAITINAASPAEQFDHTPILVVLDGVFGLRDKVGVVFSAHGYRAYGSLPAQSVNNRSVGQDGSRTISRP